VAILGVIGVSLGWSAFRTASQTMIIDYTKITQRGQAIGLSSMMIGIGHMIGSSATGLLSDTLQDIALAMRWMSVITLTSFFLSVMTRETKANQ
jgi:MFS family permease